MPNIGGRPPNLLSVQLSWRRAMKPHCYAWGQAIQSEVAAPKQHLSGALYSGISVLAQQRDTIYRLQGFQRIIIFLRRAQGWTDPVCPTRVPKLLTTPLTSGFVRTPPSPSDSGSLFPGHGLSYPAGSDSIAIAHHIPKQPPRQMSFRQKKPVVASMFHQPSARLHQPLLQASSDQFSIAATQPPP